MEMNFDPMTGEPIQKKKKAPVSTLTIAIIVGVAAFIAAGGLVLAKVLPKAVLGKNDKIVTAFAHTFQPNQLLDALIPMDIAKGGKYTVSTEAEVENTKIKAAVAVNLPSQIFAVEGSGSYRGVKLEAAAQLSKGEILVSIPMLSDRTLYYSYEKKKNGYLKELIEDEGLKLDLEEVDETFKNLMSEKNRDKKAKIMKDASLKALKLLEFKKSDKREVKINGKKCDCQGYKMNLDEDLILDICDIYEKALDECMKDMELMDSLASGSFKSSDLFDEIRHAAEDAEGTISVYLYKKKVAAIAYEAGRQELVIEFQGGNTPWENTVVSVNDREVMELSGSFDKKKEKVELTAMGQEIFSYKYDVKSGDLKLSVMDDEMELEGTVLKTAKGVTYKLEDLSMDGYRVDAECTIEIKKGAASASLNKKNMFDLGSASESEWEDFIEECQENVSGLYF